MKACCEKYLGELLGDDVDLMFEIYEEYVRSVHEKKSAFVEALNAENWESVKDILNSLKGNAFASGDKEMAETAAFAIEAAIQHDKEACLKQIARIEELAALF